MIPDHIRELSKESTKIGDKQQTCCHGNATKYNGGTKFVISKGRIFIF